MKIKQILTLLFFLFFYISFSQEINIDHINQYDSLLIKHKENKRFKDYANLAHTISIKYSRKGDFLNATKYALEEVKFKKYLPLKKQKNSLYNLGVYSYVIGDYSMSSEAFNKVIDSFYIDEYTYLAYCENARNYQKLGDYYRAKDYYKKGLIDITKIPTHFLPKKYLNYISLNRIINCDQCLEENKEKLKTVDSLSKILPAKRTNFYHLYNEYGSLFKQDKYYDFAKSRDYLFKFLNKAFNEKNHKMIAMSCNNLAILYNIEKNDSVLYYINTGLKSVKNEVIKANLIFNEAEYYFNSKKINKSLQTLQTALELTLTNTIDSSISYTPSFKETSLSIDKVLSYSILTEKAKYILDDKKLSSNKKLLNTAYESILLADKLIDFIRRESLDVQSKLFWQEKSSEIYMLGVKACFKLDKANEALFFIEKNKALLLLENIAANKIEKKSKIPLSTLQKLYDLKKEIYAIENDLYKNKALKDRYVSLKIEYNRFFKSIKDLYPDYYNSKQPIFIQPIESIKKKLDKNTTILEYIVDESDGYLLTISKNSTKLYELNDVTNLSIQINDYLKLIRRPLNTIEELKSHEKLSSKLFNSLFPFKNKDVLKNKLLIVPDNTLQNLPFESLKKDNHYLIKNFEISYAYSLSFLDTNKKLKRNTNHSFLGFAPITFNYDNLLGIPQSGLEIQSIKDKLNGDILLDTFATKFNFFSKINDYKIIHLSTHANANDSIAPWIAFKNAKLYLNELYTNKNQAELVVLNACNSSLGQISSGEGVFSLARGFFYSGTNSVISSLWNVNDKSNTEITTSFYNYLKDGKTKSASLRQAKLDYLNSHSLSEISPYYWSSLILIGDDSVIKFKNDLFYYSILICVIISCLIFYFKIRG